MFEEAARLKLRFETTKGILSCEDLWDLPLTSVKGVSLDGMARTLNSRLKDGREESFVEKPVPDPEVVETELKLEIVKRVIQVRLEERDKAQKATERKGRKEKIMQILADKQDDALRETSPKKLRKMLDELDD